MPYDFTLSSKILPSGRTAHFAKRKKSTETEFLVGYQTHYQDNTGLYNTGSGNPLFNAADFPQFGFWSSFIAPTAQAESKRSFVCLNTYDRAKFTFSFMQYAAHVPNGDFVRFLKGLLSRPAAKNYFPKLSLKAGRIFYNDKKKAAKQLESDTSTQALMDYLNPTSGDVDEQELICCARLIHWATNDVKHQALQVQTATENFKAGMVEYSKRFGLNGVPAKVCAMVCDIRHQGRAKNDRIALALSTGGNQDLAFDNLCTIGEANYAERIKTVRGEIEKLVANGVFNKKYDQGTNAFV